MPTSEKEINVDLLARLDIIEDALELAEKENAKETVAYLQKRKKQVERMLYQKPPITSE